MAMAGWPGDAKVSKIWERQPDAVQLFSRYSWHAGYWPTTRAIRNATKPKPVVTARLSPASSTARFAAP